LSAYVTIRVIAAVMELPWQDDEWLARLRQSMNDIQGFLDRIVSRGNDEASTQRAIDATRAIREATAPFVDARPDGTGDDLISKLWRDGPSILADWSDEDVRTNVRHMFFAGTDTTALAINNALHLLLTDRELFEQVIAADESGVAAFVEEALRLYGSMQ